MSFSRAKIHRFNDVSNSVPSPTKYDPKVGDKVKGGCILKAETTIKQMAYSDTASASSGKSIPVPIFRTPQVPKKHNCLGIPSAEKAYPGSAFKSITFKAEDHEFLQQDDTEEVNALKIECSNKTETICDLEKHIQDLKAQIADHEKSKNKLQSYISELESSKATLECIKANNDNYEQQISNFEKQVEEMEKRVEALNAAQVELILKVEESEKKNNKLEESNLDYERKIISLEGTIEQLEMECKNKEDIIEELKLNEETYKVNHKIAIECLTGKISTLENEMKELEANKSKNEATIFGFETQISNLNCLNEQLKSEKIDLDTLSKDLQSRLKDFETACKHHNDTITGLDMQLGERTKELSKLNETNEILKAEINDLKKETESEKEMLMSKLNDVTIKYEKHCEEVGKKHSEQVGQLTSQIYELEKEVVKVKELLSWKEEAEAKIGDLESILQAKEGGIASLKQKEEQLIIELNGLKEEKDALISTHAQEVLRLQDEYEKELLFQMQEYSEKNGSLQHMLDEAQTSLQHSKQKYINMCTDMKNNYERRLQEAEKNFNDLTNRLESKHLETVERLQDDNQKRLKDLEIDTTKQIETKNKEIAILSEQYQEILDEMKGLIKDIEKKDEEMKKATATNDSLNARLKIMLEEIKLLNKENEVKAETMKTMISKRKYEVEALKNEKLSEKLGELDCQITQLKDDLKAKISEGERIAEELRKAKEQKDNLHMRKLDLETTVVELKDKIYNLRTEVNTQKSNFDSDLQKISAEANELKMQCRKYEIVMANTRESLQALGNRLIESENEVEKLNSDNSELKNKLMCVENEKNDLENKYQLLMEAKRSLDQEMSKMESANNNLVEKCMAFESKVTEMEGAVKELNEVKESLQKVNQAKEKHLCILNDLLKQQELQLIETEKGVLDHVSDVNNALTENLEFFMKFSTEKIEHLTIEMKNLESEKSKVEAELKSKSDDYENLATDNEILKTTFEIAMKEADDLKKHYEEQSIEFEELQKNLLKLNDESMSKVSGLKEELNTKQMEAESMEQTISSLNRQLDEKESELQACIEEKTRQQQKIRQKTIEIEELLLGIDKVRTAFELSEANCKSYEQTIKDLKDKKFSLEETISKQIAEILGLKQKKTEVENELDDLRSHEKRIKDQNSKLQEEVKLLRKKVAEKDDGYAKKCETLLKEAQECQQRKEYYKANCRRLETLVTELTEEKKSLSTDFNEIHALLQEKDAEVQALLKREKELESLIGPFREQLEQYETERMFIESDREQLRKQHLEQAAKLGHQNHKQKIQHVVKLKNDLLESRKENEKLVLEVKNLKKTVEKLREETGQHPKRLFIGGKRPSSTPFKGKENSSLLSPNSGMVTPITVKQEPMSPGSPLRNRNQ